MRKGLVERRKYERLSLSIPVFVKGLDSAGKAFVEFATAVNVSAGGILLFTRRGFPKRSHLSLEIPIAPLPDLARPTQSVRKFKAKIVRVTSLERGHLLGLRLDRPLIKKGSAPPSDQHGSSDDRG